MSTYFTLPTAIGRAMISNAIALSQQVDLTHMAIGDGNGQPVIPNEQMVELPGEKYRAPISDTQVNPDDPTQFYVDLVVPQSVGGWVGNCVGVYASNGALFAVANIPAAPKPIISEGAGRELTVRIYLAVENASVVNIVVNPTMVLATRDWAQREFWNKNDLVKQSNVNDRTPGRLMIVEAFGLGALGSAPKIPTFNAYQPAGFFSADPDIPGSPDVGWGSYLVSMGSSSPDRSAYLAARSGSPNLRAWLVRREGGTLSKDEIIFRNSIVGLVTQALGVPTGAIIEYGQNASGGYLKLAGGILICWTMNAPQSALTSTSTGGGNLYRTQLLNWSFPSHFSSAPCVFGLSPNNLGYISPVNKFPTYCEYYSVAPNNGASSVNTQIFAIGTWYQG